MNSGIVAAAGVPELEPQRFPYRDKRIGRRETIDLRHRRQPWFAA